MQGNFTHAVGVTLRDSRSLTPLVLVMGFIGASLRYLLEGLLPANGGFPAATLIVNIIGCFTLEIINQYVARKTKLPAPLVRSMGIGLVGAFTTIAALSTENLAFLQAERYGMFALYLSVTALATFLSAWAGKMVADRLGRRSGTERRKCAGATNCEDRKTACAGNGNADGTDANADGASVDVNGTASDSAEGGPR